MVFPGTGSHSPLLQSLISLCETSPALSWAIGKFTKSLMGSEKCVFAKSLVAFAISRNIFQSLLDSHSGSMAFASGWIKECISVLFRSVFSYHDAAGKTISEYNAEVSILKFRFTIKSIFPFGLSLLNLMSFTN